MIEGSQARHADARDPIPTRLLRGSALFSASAAQFTSTGDALNSQAVVFLDAQGYIASWDEAAQRLFQRFAAETLGQHVATLYEQSDVQQGLPAQAVSLALGTSRHSEQGLRLRGDGTTFWASFLYMTVSNGSAANESLLLVVTDLSAAQAAEHEIARVSAELRQRVTDFETLLNVLPVGIGIALDPACREIQVNRAFADVLGLQPGQNASKTAPPDERPTNFRCYDDAGKLIPDDQLPMQIAARDGRELRDVEMNVVHGDGRAVRLLQYAAPLLDPSGQPRGCVAAFVDITERNRIARQHQFLMRLDDALRPLADAREITATAARLLGEQLQASRCAYADVEDDQETFNVIGDYTDGVPSVVGRYQLWQFGDDVAAFMRQNKPYMAADAANQLTPNDPHILDQMQIRSGICVPLHKHNRLVAMMAILHDTPRVWTEADVELLQQVSSRSWESIERTKVARSLRESEVRFRQLVDAVEDYAIFMLDPRGCVSSWNNGARRITGYAAEDILGRHIEAFYTTEEQIAGRARRALDVASERGRYEAEGRRVRKDGSQFWASVVVSAIRDETGALVGFAKITRDITERKRAEQMFRMAVQAAASAMILVNQQGLIVFANTLAEEIFGYSPEELIGACIEMLVPERMRELHVIHRLSYAVDPKTRAMAEGRELYARRKDGSEFPAEIGLNPLETDEGLLILTSIIDVTARRQAARREREQLAQLAHAGRLASLGEMVSELTHEINQPLAAAANYGRACLRFARGRDGASIDQLIELVAKSVAQTERAGEIVKRLSGFIRKTPPTQTRIDVNALVRDMIALTAPGRPPQEDAASGVTIETDLDDGLPQVLGDRVQIEQVLVNLIRNALDAMKDLSPYDRLLRIQTARCGEELIVAVSDRGGGIPDEAATRLFEPFFTTKPHGVGLGLSISRSIIQAHGGTIWAKSNPHGGACFSFTLPIAQESSVHASSHGLHH